MFVYSFVNVFIDVFMATDKLLHSLWLCRSHLLSTHIKALSECLHILPTSHITSRLLSSSTVHFILQLLSQHSTFIFIHHLRNQCGIQVLLHLYISSLIRWFWLNWFWERFWLIHFDLFSSLATCLDRLVLTPCVYNDWSFLLLGSLLTCITRF